MSTHFIFREARVGDLAEIETILEAAVDRMLAEGKHQWTRNYPHAAHVIADIGNNIGYVLELDKKVVAYGAVILTGEPAYEHLQGDWLTDSPYVVVHRLAVSQDYQGRGIARKFIETVEAVAAPKGIGSFRIDTNYDNDRMLTLLEKCGFEYCGDVSYESGSRMAFEKII